MKRHRRDLTVMSEINLTNLVDTSFVLLIGFMLMAPTIKHGITLDLPTVGSAGTLSTDTKTVTIVVQKPKIAGGAEMVYIEDQAVTIEKNSDAPDVASVIQKKRALFPKMDVVVEGDSTSSFGTFAKVMTVLRNIGINDIGIVEQMEQTAPNAVKKNK